MSISSLSGLTTSYASAYTSVQPPSGKDGQDGFLATAAKALGMSTDDVKSALQSGSSLADLAKTAGVSETDLVKALEANAPDDLKASGKLDEITTKMVETKGLHRPQGPPPSSGSSDDATGVLSGSLTSSQSTTLNLLSSLLGTDSSTLSSELQSGTSLADLASEGGVSYNQLASVLQNGLMVDAKL